MAHNNDNCRTATAFYKSHRSARQSEEPTDLVVAPLLVENGEVVEHLGYLLRVGPKDSLADLKSPLEQRLGVVHASARMKQAGKIVEAAGHQRVVRSHARRVHPEM
eukprot:scaffold262997_cov26-Prasinocladus_malaysianus.AAC.2